MTFSRYLFIVLLLSVANHIVAQNNIEFSGKYHDYPYKRNNVRLVKQYLTYPDDTSKQILLKHEYFNEFAYMKERRLYSEKGDEISKESYIYKNDTLLISSRYESLINDLQYTTELKYNKIGQLTKSTTKNGDKVLSKRKYKWNKKRSKLKMINDLGNSKIKKEFKYDDQGRVTSMRLLGKRNRDRSIKHQTTAYLDNDVVETKIYFEQGSKNYVIIEKIKDHQELIKNNSSTPWFDLGFGKGLKIERGDEVKKVFYYFENGLLSRKERYLNNKLESTIIYEYTEN